jgi:hypothetical protein
VEAWGQIYFGLLDSHHVPNDVPQAIPNCTTLHPVPFAYNSTIYNNIEGKAIQSSILEVCIVLDTPP